MALAQQTKVSLICRPFRHHVDTLALIGAIINFMALTAVKSNQIKSHTGTQKAYTLSSKLCRGGFLSLRGFSTALARCNHQKKCLNHYA